jgi:ketosteroid isomerase-like protein
MISKKALYLAAAAVLSINGACVAIAQTPPAKPAATPAPVAGTKPVTPAAKPIAVPGVDATIRAILDRQVFDWNRGDTDGFLLAYAEDAIFVSDTITRGLEKLRARYQSHYPTRASMGKLTFSDLEIKTLDANSTFVIGHFKLERDAEGGGDSHGVFTLLFKRGAKGWKIAVDHTS